MIENDPFSIGNVPWIHELTSKLSDCKQSGQSVVVYYGELKKIWDELAGYSKVYACTCDAILEVAEERENAKVNTFLVILDSNLYGNVVSNLVMLDPLPILNTTFAKVVTYEHHQSVAHAQQNKADVVGFATQGVARGRGSGHCIDRTRTNGLCTHCGKPGHEQDSCF